MKHTKLVVISLLFYMFATACEQINPVVDSESLKTIDMGKFSITMPQNWYQVEKAGFDLASGEITNGQDKLYFQYGWFTNELSNLKLKEHLKSQIVLDGYNADLIEPVDNKLGTVGLTVELNLLTDFSIYGTSIKNKFTAIQIIKSVKFND